MNLKSGRIVGCLVVAGMAVRAASYGPPRVLERAKLLPPDVSAHDTFGYAVAVHGDTLVVGAHGDDQNGADAGAVYIYRRSPTTVCEWSLIAKRLASDGAAGDWFGRTLALDGDTLVVGAFFHGAHGPDSGAAYVFERHAGGTDNWGEVAKLTASDAQANSAFGIPSLHGDTLAIGAPWDSGAAEAGGAVYLFERHAGGTDNWGEVAKLTAPAAAADDWFGLPVAVHGDTLAVGAEGDDDMGIDAGAVYVFERHAGGANQWGLSRKLTAADGRADDRFGSALALEGNTLVAGARRNDEGLLDMGAAYVLKRHLGGAENWGLQKKLMPSDGIAFGYFGVSVALCGDSLVVGAYFDDDNGFRSGSAYVFRRDAGGADAWGEVAKFLASDGSPDDLFGIGVDVSGHVVVAGAQWHDAQGENAGAAYVCVPGEAVSFPLAFAPGWKALCVWDAGVGAWTYIDDVHGPDSFRVPGILPNRWYWIAVWDYRTGTWSFANWYYRLG